MGKMCYNVNHSLVGAVILESGYPKSKLLGLRPKMFEVVE